MISESMSQQPFHECMLPSNLLLQVCQFCLMNRESESQIVMLGLLIKIVKPTSRMIANIYKYLMVFGPTVVTSSESIYKLEQTIVFLKKQIYFKEKVFKVGDKK